MKTILVPTDFSMNAARALRFAVKLAKKLKGEIVLLHAHQMYYANPEVPVEFISAQLAQLAKDADKKMQTLANRISSVEKVKCTALNKEGDTIRVILDVVKKNKIDLIVMGTKGAGGIKKILMGSNTAGIIEKAKCPVLAVPAKSEMKSLKKILYATDYRKCDAANLAQLLDIARLFKSEITFLHIAGEAYTHSSERTLMEEFKTKIKKAVKYKALRFELAFSPDMLKKLDACIKDKKPDLLVMATQHRSLIDKIFWNSATKKMAFHSKTPLLAFHFTAKSEGIA